MKQEMELEVLLQSAGMEGIKRRGDTILALCPNPSHNDRKLGSFVVNEDKGIMKCFACGFFSTISEFLVNNGVPVEDALKYLVAENEKGERKRPKEFMLGRAIPKSLLDRGFTIETLKYFGVGYDKFAKVTTIPLYEEQELIGIAYRRYPKYFSYSDGFEKRDFIYNFKKGAEEGIFTEGFSDVWRTFQNRYKNVFATLGTAVTKEQYEKMRRMKRIILGYDLDFAGLATSFKIYEELKYDCEILILPIIPDLGEKPDLGNCSGRAFNRAYKHTMFFAEFWSSLIIKDSSLTDKIENYAKGFKQVRENHS
jgi:DNA primase